MSETQEAVKKKTNGLETLRQEVRDAQKEVHTESRSLEENSTALTVHLKMHEDNNTPCTNGWNVCAIREDIEEYIKTDRLVLAKAQERARKKVMSLVKRLLLEKYKELGKGRKFLAFWILDGNGLSLMGPYHNKDGATYAVQQLSSQQSGPAAFAETIDLYLVDGSDTLKIMHW